MNQRRVVVTGLGAVSSVGNDVKTVWNAVKNGESGIDNITLFDASEHFVQIVLISSLVVAFLKFLSEVLFFLNRICH